MVGNGQFGDSSGLRGNSNGKWGNAINDDPIRGTNGLTVDLGGNDQKLRDEEPKVSLQVHGHLASIRFSHPWQPLLEVGSIQ